MAGKNSIIPNQDGPLDNPRKRKPLPSHPLGRYLFADHSICNFAISGAGPLQAVVTDVLRVTQGVLPVIILHGNDTNMMGLSATLWQEKYGNGNGNNNAPFWVCGNGSFEPFLGMDPMDVADTMQLLARNAGFECTAHFNEVVQGHLHLLSHLGCDCCLSGLYYLASFKNLAEFESNINALNCSENEKQAILWELGLSDRENKKQFDIFRNVILRLAHEAKNSGWTPDNVLGTMNISTAIQKRATLLLNIDSNRSEYLMQYICQELRIHNQEIFMLLIDDVQLANSGLCALLKTPRVGFRFGLLSENLVGMIGEERSDLEMVAEKIQRLILFKHSMDTTAQVLSDLIGKDYIERTTVTKSSDRRWLSFTPDRSGRSVATSREKEHRVESKEIINLAPGQAIVFDAISNKIIRH